MNDYKGYEMVPGDIPEPQVVGNGALPLVLLPRDRFALTGHYTRVLRVADSGVKPHKETP